MSEDLYLKVGRKTLERLDKRRGDLKRDEYILKVLVEHLESDGKVKFANPGISELSDNPNSSASDTSILIENLQDFANGVYKRLDKLEDKINDLPDEIVVSVESDVVASNNKVAIDDEERKNIFKFPSEDADEKSEEVTFEISDDEYSDMDITDSGVESGSEFEYGCPYCNATIPENATRCPKCGANFNDMDNAYTEVEPLSEGYSSSGGYDPRPNYIKHHGNGLYRPEAERRDLEGPTPKGYEMPDRARDMPKKAPLCMNCGGNLNFIDDMKRWYCYRCNKYFGGPHPGAEQRPRSNLDQGGGPKRQPQIQRAGPGGSEPRTDDYPKGPRNPEPKRQRDPNRRPLKDYYKYSK